ncbi:MAG TPA: hypothetical protein VL404_02460 [Candidatus Eisenbacteria bacterium]|jgi:hypothetical protein|nr:hypothetical protein [Candidatus Eisenbacteria bacterium]
MDRRKLLVCFLVACLALAGAEAALASIPHVHGADVDHSSHQGCAVHQLALHGFQAETAAPFVACFVLFLLYLTVPRDSFAASVHFSESSSRAPPAAS